ncbi:elongation factor G [Thalassoglobus polymorphus]|uniref:Elongation factor G n=1 Tax=Thalassoglobus polymorphus TaxID=2527994 RepID=A0A517QS10_9PLAN|nr:elongation factor G [Thalassoglobus polymorphus]QDT34414.1 Elongation factor G 1 [Thalassoglobus polymorphus]
MPGPIEKLRNIGIVAHIDAGKTTTTERILYYTGAIHRMGNVDDGNTETDFDEEEAKRGITIYSAAVTCKWKDCTINLIDTPGHVDFTAEVQRSLRVLDGAVVIFSAVEGVEAQSETVWRQADEYKTPRMCFINKMDRIGANFENVLEQIRKRLHGNPLPLFLPIGAEHDFEGIIDLVKNKALYFDPDSQGQSIEEKEIPEELQEMAAEYRQKLIETVAERDEAAMEEYFENGDLPEETIHRLIREATLTGELQPTFTGSSLDYIGVQPILDGVNRYLPSPLDIPPVKGINPNPKRNESTELVRHAKNDEPLAALIFKIVADKHADLCFVRVYSGVLKSGSRLLNPRTGKKEFCSQIWHIQADSREKVETDLVEAGDICGIIGPKAVATGDTLCPQQHPILLESIIFPETVISMAVEPETSGDKKKLEDALVRLSRQDPTFKTQVSEETGQTIISGMGELHLEVLKERMQRDFNLNVRVHKPRVSYRETVTAAGEAQEEFNRSSQGDTHFASVKVRIEPGAEDTNIVVTSEIPPGTLPGEIDRIVREAVSESAQSGGIVGFPLMKVRITILDVGYRDGETNEEALRSASAHAVQSALNNATISLLEPVMKLEVVTPSDFVGNIQADLNQRMAKIFASEIRGHLTALQAEVSLANMFGYSSHVRSLSQGRASFSMQPLKYDLAPASVMKEFLG